MQAHKHRFRIADGPFEIVARSPPNRVEVLGYSSGSERLDQDEEQATNRVKATDPCGGLTSRSAKVPCLMMRNFVLSVNDEIAKLPGEFRRKDHFPIAESGTYTAQSIVKEIASFAAKFRQMSNALHAHNLWKVAGVLLE